MGTMPRNEERAARKSHFKHMAKPMLVASSGLMSSQPSAKSMAGSYRREALRAKVGSWNVVVTQVGSFPSRTSVCSVLLTVHKMGPELLVQTGVVDFPV